MPLEPAGDALVGTRPELPARPRPRSLWLEPGRKATKRGRELRPPGERGRSERGGGHRDLQISPEEFDEVAAELGGTLDAVGVPEQEKGEVLAAFAAHKDEATEGYMAAWGR